ncbi:exodeoxyribonuclease VII large subunit [Alphaproteobacteria bacterium]|nr:exodeoxyribonuclease VII large subunit [Alphaproteobacteria bacterium]
MSEISIGMVPENIENSNEFSVTELSSLLKKTVEKNFELVRVRGEVSRIFLAQSGHAYITLKDENAVLETICFRNVYETIQVALKQGMEVIFEGRLSTFPKKSQYQLIVKNIKPAGIGALMAMLEKTKKRLIEEGLFSDENKKSIPFMPEVIGVITSIKGAVIKDILHRFKERFPSHVLIWPTLVQGDEAPDQIIRAIKGFNSLSKSSKVVRPDIIIIARGGGSIEDLWCFNDEELVREVVKSNIPIISAIGHETDITLVDFAADKRAPTPTAAAEITVPVKLDILKQLKSFENRLSSNLLRQLGDSTERLVSSSKRLGTLDDILNESFQRLDFSFSKFILLFKNNFNKFNNSLALNQVKPSIINMRVKEMESRLLQVKNFLEKSFTLYTIFNENKLELFSKKLDYNLIVKYYNTSFNNFNSLSKLFVSLSIESILQRGFVLVRDKDNKFNYKNSKELIAGEIVSLNFFDGYASAKIINKELKKNITTKSELKIQNSLLKKKVQGDLF